MNETAQHIEAILFYKSEPVEIRELEKRLDISTTTVTNALTELESALNGHGVQLVRSDTAVELVTAAAVDATISNIKKNEVEGDLGKAALETLAIILYTGPTSRAHIDYIRGVNSTFILRRLMQRGLITRVSSTEARNQYKYQATTELLKHLGVGSVSELPEYGEMQVQLASFIATQEELAEQS